MPDQSELLNLAWYSAEPVVHDPVFSATDEAALVFAWMSPTIAAKAAWSESALLPRKAVG